MAANLLNKAELLKKYEEKIKDGENLTKEETGSVKALSPQEITGLSEAERVTKLGEIEQMLQE